MCTCVIGTLEVHIIIVTRGPARKMTVIGNIKYHHVSYDLSMADLRVIGR